MLAFVFQNEEDDRAVLSDILRHKITGAVCYNVLSPEQTNQFLQAIPLLQNTFFTDLNYSNGFSLPLMFGQLFKTASVELVEKYFAQTEPFLNAANKHSSLPTEKLVDTFLAKAFAPFKTEVLPDFLPYSFRIVFADKGGLFLHRDGELLDYIHEKGSEKIKEHIKPDTMMSWFFTLQEPESGGELWVADSQYDQLQKEGPTHLKKADGTLIENENTLQHILVKAPANSLLLFRGGSHWHKVIAPAKGCKERITLGGFLALSTDGSQIYYWS